MKNLDLEAAVMSNHAAMLRTLSDALSLDLAISPIVIASPPGIATSTTMSDIARALNMPFLDLRCAQIHDSQLQALPVLVDGELEERQPRLAALSNILAKDAPTLILLDDAVANGSGVAKAVIAIIQRDATAPVVVALRTDREGEDAALAAIGEALSIHRALVPTARLDMPTSPTAQTILVAGWIDEVTAKHGRRFVEMSVREPYPHTIRFTVVAEVDQSEDELNGALLDITECAVRLETVNGELECRTSDIVAL